MSDPTPRALATLVAIVLTSCSGGSARHAGARRNAGSAAPPLTSVAVDAGAADAGNARPWWERDGTYAAELRGRTKDPLLLVATARGIVARTADEATTTTLVAGAVTSSRYDASLGVLWFVRATQLVALDLGAPRAEPIVILDGMPDLPFDVAPCDVCVRLDLESASVRLETTPSDPATADRKQIAIATSARPALTGAGKLLLERLHARVTRPPRIVDLDPAKTFPVPPAAGALDRCERKPSSSLACCTGGCRHAFDLAGFGWRLLVAGRRCDCSHDRCWAMCVLLDPATGRFASVDHPEHWSHDAVPTDACHPTLDSAGTAYVLATRVCTVHGCTAVGGQILDWLVPGTMMGRVPEEMSACPE